MAAALPPRTRQRKAARRHRRVPGRDESGVDSQLGTAMQGPTRRRWLSPGPQLHSTPVSGRTRDSATRPPENTLHGGPSGDGTGKCFRRWGGSRGRRRMTIRKRCKLSEHGQRRAPAATPTALRDRSLEQTLLQKMQWHCCLLDSETSCQHHQSWAAANSAVESAGSKRRTWLHRGLQQNSESRQEACTSSKVGRRARSGDSRRLPARSVPTTFVPISNHDPSSRNTAKSYCSAFLTWDVRP